MSQPICLCCHKPFKPRYDYEILCSRYCGNVYALRLAEVLEETTARLQTQLGTARQNLADAQKELFALRRAASPQPSSLSANSLAFIRSIVDEGLPRS